MLSAGLDLLNALVKVVDRKASLDRKYFEDFIQPTWEAFVKVHTDYMHSLEAYQNAIKDTAEPVTELIETIRHDFVMTTDLRTELMATAGALPKLRLSNNQLLIEFASAIEAYLGRRVNFSVGEDKSSDTNLKLSYSEARKRERIDPGRLGYAPPEQYVRSPLIAYLSRKANETDRSHAAKMFEIFAMELQEKYGEVGNAYYSLRGNLLS